MVEQGRPRSGVEIEPWVLRTDIFGGPLRTQDGAQLLYALQQTLVSTRGFVCFTLASAPKFLAMTPELEGLAPVLLGAMDEYRERTREAADIFTRFGLGESEFPQRPMFEPSDFEDSPASRRFRPQLEVFRQPLTMFSAIVDRRLGEETIGSWRGSVRQEWAVDRFLFASPGLIEIANFLSISGGPTALAPVLVLGVAWVAVTAIKTAPAFLDSLHRFGVGPAAVNQRQTPDELRHTTLRPGLEEAGELQQMEARGQTATRRAVARIHRRVDSGLISPPRSAKRKERDRHAED